jgi:serine/threonine protein phosphatase PrpC
LGDGRVLLFTQRSPEKDTENEDTVAAFEFANGSLALIIADGAGGLPAGRRASQTAVRAMLDSLQSTDLSDALLRTAILNGFEAANDALLAQANGSATTMTVVTVENGDARSYHVGDSEAIVVGQKGRLKLETTAHSPTGFAVEAGFLDRREALHHEDRHLVFNFLGMNDMRVEIGTSVRLAQRDTILIASDGLSDNLHIEEIVECIRKGPLEDALDTLVTGSIARMVSDEPGLPSKPDDLSVILYRRSPPAPGSSTSASQQAER